MMEIIASFDIDAPAETVWSVLTDLDKFHIWNPFIRQAWGSTAVGGTVQVRVRSSLGIPLRFRAQVYDCERDRRLRWRGQLATPWLACGDHSFTVEPLGEHRARLVQRETFTGVLPWLARRLIARETQRGFDAMNLALAERARSVHAAADLPRAAAQAPLPAAAQAPLPAAATPSSTDVPLGNHAALSAGPSPVQRPTWPATGRQDGH